MKKLFILFAGCFTILSAEAQLVSSSDLFISSGVTVTLNGELSNTGNFQSMGDLHLRKGLTNHGQMSLNGQVVMDGEGSQTIQSLNLLKTGVFVMSQMGKVVLQAPLLIEQQLILGNGILMNTEQNPLAIADNATVMGASNSSHVKGFVRKLGDDAFQFPVGSGSELQAFRIAKPSSYDEVQVGYVRQSPISLAPGRTLEIDEFSMDSYWSVKGSNESKPIQISVTSEDKRQQILQLRNNQWGITSSSSVNNVISSEALLSGVTYFTIGTQKSELFEKADVSIFPNPSNGSFEVRLKGFSPEEKVEFDIVDLNGKSFTKQNGQVKDLKTKYDLNKEMNSGSYILRVTRTDKNQVFNQKISINP